MAYITVITHNGTFHADEVTACALIKAFYAKKEDYVEIIRVPHQADVKEIKEALTKANKEVFIVDIGREYNPDEKLFDHHQFSADEDGRSSAGMVYDWLKEVKPEEFTYIDDELRMMIGLIDKNDIGIRPSEPGEIAWAVSYMNAVNVHGKDQYSAFNKAVNFVYNILKGLRDKNKTITETYKVISEKGIIIEREGVNGKYTVLEVPEYLLHWQEAIHEYMKEKGLNIDIITWYDDRENTWKAQNVPATPTSFQPYGKAIMYVAPENLPDDLQDKVIFVHKGNFFGVWKDREAMYRYLDLYAK